MRNSTLQNEKEAYLMAPQDGDPLVPLNWHPKAGSACWPPSEGGGVHATNKLRRGERKKVKRISRHQTQHEDVTNTNPFPPCLLEEKGGGEGAAISKMNGRAQESQGSLKRFKAENPKP